MDDKEAERIAELADENLDLALAELDEAILLEDPDFAKNLGSIDIDDSLVLKALDSANKPALQTPETGGNSVLGFFKTLVNVKKHPKKVLGFWTLLALLITLAIYIQITKLWIGQTKLFITSFADLGAPIYDLNPETEVELFFENPKLARNLVTLSRMVANVVATSNSSKNPMLAIELNVEGMNTEVVVEIKDREAEFKHYILRLVELEDYDTLNTEKGKVNLALKLRDEMNTNLTRGQVRKVMYKSFVIKR